MAAAGLDPQRRAILDQIEKVQVETVIEDLERHRPNLIFVEEGEWRLGFKDMDFDYLEYFGRDPRFAMLWSEYEELTRIAQFRVFRRRLAD